MKEYTTVKLRLHPTADQAVLMEKTFGCCRWLWNRMLADAEEFYAASDLQYIPTPARYKKGGPFPAGGGQPAALLCLPESAAGLSGLLPEPRGLSVPAVQGQEGPAGRLYRLLPSVLHRALHPPFEGQHPNAEAGPDPGCGPPQAPAPMEADVRDGDKVQDREILLFHCLRL